MTLGKRQWGSGEERQCHQGIEPEKAADNPNAEGVLAEQPPLPPVSVPPGSEPHGCTYNSAVSFSVCLHVCFLINI